MTSLALELTRFTDDDDVDVADDDDVVVLLLCSLRNTEENLDREKYLDGFL